VVLSYTYLQRILPILFSAVLGMASAAAMAADYGPDEFLNLDLSKAALSPKPLGPANSFGPIPSTILPERDAARPRARTLHATHPQATAHALRGAARVKLAGRHRNPLDAQAMDTRVQVWPCKAGGICRWKQ